MKMVKCLDPHEVLERGINALYKEFGPIETRRFITLAHDTPREDCVKRHRRWQAGLNKDEFVARIKAAHQKARQKSEKI